MTTPKEGPAKKKRFNVTLDPEQLSEVERLADKLEMTHEGFVKECVLTGLKEAGDLDEVGRIDSFFKGKKAIDKVKQMIQFNADPRHPKIE